MILKGDPGCGKSTRIPQYILEAWAQEADDEKPCKIAVTQPRRIAAVSLAKRVASERYEIVTKKNIFCKFFRYVDLFLGFASSGLSS